MSFIFSIITFTSISLVGVMGIFLITGLTGLFSLGQASFMAIGAYVSGVLVTRFGLSFPRAIVVAIFTGLFFGFIVGAPVIHLKRHYIALITFGFGEAIIAVLNNTANITGGAMGLYGIPRYTSTWLAVLSALVCVYLVRNFKYSKFGRQCIALRNDELAAKTMGININRIKMLTFLIAGMMTSYAGVLYGFYTTYVDPGLFGWTRSAEWIIILFFGGINSLTGAIFAAIVLKALPEVLRFASEWRIVIYCVIILFILNFRPMGIFGEYELNIASIRHLLTLAMGKTEIKE